MSKTRFWIGISVTVLWLILPAILAWNELSREGGSQLKLNEWGDFFAGFLSPLAFLWLVLGYFQQGEELKLSNEALKLQAEELKNAVEQQRDLVEVTRQQVEAERESLQRDIAIRKKSIQPVLSVVCDSGYISGGIIFSHEIKISNAGCAVRDFCAFTSVCDGVDDQFVSASLFKSGAVLQGNYETRHDFDDSNSFFKVSYVDNDGDKNLIVYRMTRTKMDSVGLAFTEISTMK